MRGSQISDDGAPCARGTTASCSSTLSQPSERETSDATRDPTDRRPRRRRLLDGARQLAARRLRPLADRRRPRRACASCRPPPATPTTTSCASTGASPPRCEASHVSLFRRDQGTGGVEDDLASHLLAQDLIYVGGGNVVSMLGAWRAHGLDDDPAQGVAQGHRAVRAVGRLAVLVRRGAQRLPRRPARVRGLGLLPYSNCVHYDAEPARRAEYHRFVADGMRAGFAAEDGVALHFRGTRLERVVSSRPDGSAYRVEPPATASSRRRWRSTYLGERRRRSAARRARARAPRERAGRARRPRRERRRACRVERRPAARAGRRVSGATASPTRRAAPDLRDGRRRLHDGARPTRCSTTSCCRSRGASEPRILFLPTASGDTTAQINAFQARFGDRCVRARAPVAVSPARRRAPARGDRARAGHRLRRRRLDAQPAGDLARARARRAARARRGGAAPCSPASAPARCAGFEGGVTRSSGPPEPIGGPRPARRLADRARRRRARAPAGVARQRARRHAARRLGARRRRRAAVPRAAPGRASSARAPAPARSASTRSPASSCATASSPSCSATARRRALGGVDEAVQELRRVHRMRRGFGEGRG